MEVMALAIQLDGVSGRGPNTTRGCIECNLKKRCIKYKRFLKSLLYQIQATAGVVGGGDRKTER